MPCVCVHSNKCVVATVCAFWCTHIATLRSGQVNMKLFLIHIIAGRLKRPYTVVDSEFRNIIEFYSKMWIKKYTSFEITLILKRNLLSKLSSCVRDLSKERWRRLRECRDLDTTVYPSTDWVNKSFLIACPSQYVPVSDSTKPYRNMFLKMLCINFIWIHLYACFSLWSIFIKQLC